MHKLLIFNIILLSCSVAMNLQGQMDTIRLRQGVPPPPPPPLPKNDTTVFKMVLEMPRFPGCEHLPAIEEKKKCSDRKLLEFFQKNIAYPAEAKANGVTGTVVISWIVEKDGSLSSPEIKKDLGSGCGDEVLRVFHLMNEKGIKWIPTSARYRAVRVQYNLPIQFTEEMMKTN